MAADVTQTLELILQVLTNISVEQSKERILELKEAGRFHEDIFGNSIKKSPIIKNDE
jgi:sulfite reductase alpha subunit-like flavoprotein